jgi:hypothetical protein
MSETQNSAQAKAAAEPKMVTASIAARRSLRIGGKQHGPGTQVRLPVDEHARLLSLGFLHDARVEQADESNGPQFRGPVGGVVKPK